MTLSEINGCYNLPQKPTWRHCIFGFLGRCTQALHQHILKHISSTMSGRQTKLLSVIFNFVLCVVVPLLLLWFCMLEVPKKYWRVELGDHLLGRRIFVYFLYRYYSDSIVSGVCSHLVVVTFLFIISIFISLVYWVLWVQVVCILWSSMLYSAKVF